MEKEKVCSENGILCVPVLQNGTGGMFGSGA
jgi:hypothetical protein